MKASFLPQMLIGRPCRIGALVCLTLLVASVSRGQIFVYNENGFAGDAAVGEYNVNGTPVNANLITGLNSSSGIAVSGSDLFVANAQSSGTIGEYTTSGATVNASLITGLNEPNAIVVSGSNLFVANYGSGTIGEYTTSGATVNASLITGLNEPTGIGVSGSNLFVLNNGSGTVGEYTTSGATVNSALISGFPVNQSLCLTVSGSYLFVGYASSGTIGEYTTSGATVNASLITDTNEPSTIAVFGSDLFVANAGFGNSGAGTIGEYTLGATPGTVTSSNASIISGLYEPYHMAVVAPAPPIINIRKAVYLTSTNLVVGFNYQVQATSNLITWTNQGSVFTATNSNWQSTNYWNVDDWSQLFFQLEVVP